MYDVTAQTAPHPRAARSLIRRLARVYVRYRSSRASATAPMPLTDSGGRLLGYADSIEFGGEWLRVRGWSIADRVTLVCGSRTAGTVPSEPRPDVEASRPAGAPSGRGFSLSVTAAEAAQAALILDQAGARHRVSLPGTRPPGRRTAIDFCLLLLRNAGPLYRYLRHGDPAAAGRLRAQTGLIEDTAPARIAPALFDAATPVVPRDPITIVLPIFNAHELLNELFDRLLRHTDLPFRALVLNDASTDARVGPLLERWRARGKGRIELATNPQNLGFVATANAGLTLARRHPGHVVLLNSDTRLPAGWASRLIAPILRDRRVATVTPMSNDAEILSVPRAGRRSALPPDAVDLIDATARRLSADTKTDLPTGIGFCMAINRRFLDRLPCFDTAFGRGYGEEVDWCQRASALGGRHHAAVNLFVGHVGGASFGTAEKQVRLARNNAEIAARYPRYDARVAAFQRHDPLAAPRLALAIAEAAATAGGPVGIYMGHSLGGGAERVLAETLAADVARQGAAVVLRAGGASRWGVELHRPGYALYGAAEDDAVLEPLLAPFRARRVVYSCAVGAADPLAVPTVLTALAAGPDTALEVLIHDFLPLSPSYCLVGADGRFHGVPGIDSADPAHRLPARHGGGAPIPLTEWRAAWGQAMRRADQITVFSEDSAGHVRRAYPETADRLRLKPHHPRALPAQVRPTAADRRVIGALGDINPPKGAAVLQALSEHLSRHATGPGLALIGNLDPRYRLAAPARTHGRYRPEEIGDLAQRYGIGCWLIPSVWPETFSFTTHEALSTGLPVFCFDLGAQAEAARRRPNGHVLQADPHDASAILRNVEGVMGW